MEGPNSLERLIELAVEICRENDSYMSPSAEESVMTSRWALVKACKELSDQAAPHVLADLLHVPDVPSFSKAMGYVGISTENTWADVVFSVVTKMPRVLATVEARVPRYSRLIAEREQAFEEARQARLMA
jgi:hypothetical protein